EIPAATTRAITADVMRCVRTTDRIPMAALEVHHATRTVTGSSPPLPSTAVASPFGRLVLIVDPRAGKGQVGAEMPEVERTVRGRGLDYRIAEVATPEDGRRLAREALAGGERFLAAVGGGDLVHF